MQQTIHIIKVLQMKRIIQPIAFFNGMLHCGRNGAFAIKGAARHGMHEHKGDGHHHPQHKERMHGSAKQIGYHENYLSLNLSLAAIPIYFWTFPICPRNMMT